jgi:tetratricopeptide (TPR) repeat protein
MIAAREPSAELYEEAVAVNRALADQIGRDRDPERWANVRNEMGYALTMAGRAENNVAHFEEAVLILREAIVVQKKIKAVPAVAFTQDSLCDVLVDLGAAQKDRAMAQEAIAACQEALVIFEERKMDDLAAGSEKNLAEAQALLAELH